MVFDPQYLSVLKTVASRPVKIRPNGENCPDCEGPLHDVNTNVIYLDPPRKATKCAACGYKGWRPIEEIRHESSET